MEESVVLNYLKRKGEKRFKTEEQLIEYLLAPGNDFYKIYLDSVGKSKPNFQYETQRKKNLWNIFMEIHNEEENLKEINDMTRDGSILDSARYVYNALKIEQNKRKQEVYELIGLIDLYQR